MSDIPQNTADEKPPLVGAALIADYVTRLPRKPGVYRMFNAQGTVLYVGKAKQLKNRVSSYAKSTGHSNRIMRMISETHAMEFIVTQTEMEALLLEANLIKQLKPRYNILLRDDKSFSYILIAEDHEAPQLVKHRGARKRKGTYFGPFASAGAVNRTLNTLEKAFLLRNCSDSVYEGRTRPCLQHQIKRCAAPCVGLISPEAYTTLVNDAKAFLGGENAKVQRALSAEMEQASSEMDFERAAALRDRIRALTYIQGNQDINAAALNEADIFAITRERGQTCVQVFFFRAGQNWGNTAFFPRHDKEDDEAEILGAFIAQFYDKREPARQILTNVAPAQSSLLEAALSVRLDRKVSIATPQRGEKKDIIDSAVMNAREALSRKMSETQSQREAIDRLASLLGIDDPIERIEVYDNSHIQGSNAVGGMIVAGPDGFIKNQYRQFTIKDESLSPGDDFGMMREVLQRRLKRLKKETDPSVIPDLIILDGGKGQLSAALDIFRALDLDPEKDGPNIIAVAKGRREDAQGAKRPDRTMAATGEQVVTIGKEPFTLPPRDPALYFIQSLRDEAHRYAIGAHRKKRKKAISENPIDDIEGVGAARRRALLHHFGSAKAIASAKPEDLAAVDGISKAMAQRIYDFFHGD